jgi:anti-sigma regulatory factor (Ser/Thr protein kinase)
MDPQDHTSANGRPPALQPMRGRRHEAVISLLTQRCEALRQGAAALKAENAELRLELRRLARSRTPSQWPGWSVDALSSWEVAVPAGPKACGAARIALADWLAPRVPQRVLEDAQLVASELVTNSVLHADVEPTTNLVYVGVEIGAGVLRLHVEDSGTAGTLAPRAPDLASGGGYGLNIVATLATRWGISRNGGTRVWADLTWASPMPGRGSLPTAHAGESG